MEEGLSRAYMEPDTLECATTPFHRPWPNVHWPQRSQRADTQDPQRTHPVESPQADLTLEDTLSSIRCGSEQRPLAWQDPAIDPGTDQGTCQQCPWNNAASEEAHSVAHLSNESQQANGTPEQPQASLPSYDSIADLI